MDTLYIAWVWLKQAGLWYLYLLPLCIPAVIIASRLHRAHTLKAFRLNAEGPEHLRGLWSAPDGPFRRRLIAPLLFWPITLLKQLWGPSYRPALRRKRAAARAEERRRKANEEFEYWQRVYDPGPGQVD